VVAIAAASMTVGASDWEAEGRVARRTVQVEAFRIDAFEALPAAPAHEDFRAASGVTRAEAEQACADRGGRLPTEDEWMVAATAGSTPRGRYPWGDTGAVCRRAAWGLRAGPCASSGAGPDTVGAHPDGDSPLGLHDMAGNVAEWVRPNPASPGIDVAKGGSWKTALATDLRVWNRLELPAGTRDDGVGYRCVFAP
jgi:formylglycine-generating enzyme required for sulfatase activity